MLFVSTLTYSQVETFNIKYNDFPQESLEDDEWCGTEIYNTKACKLLITYCINCDWIIVEGHVVYRKFYNKRDKNLIYWDIDHFSDKYESLFPNSAQILGFKY